MKNGRKGENREICKDEVMENDFQNFRSEINRWSSNNVEPRKSHYRLIECSSLSIKSDIIGITLWIPNPLTARIPLREPLSDSTSIEIARGPKHN